MEDLGRERRSTPSSPPAEIEAEPEKKKPAGTWKKSRDTVVVDTGSEVHVDPRSVEHYGASGYIPGFGYWENSVMPQATGSERPAEPIDRYTGMSLKDLGAEARIRILKASGTKLELRERIRNWDSLNKKATDAQRQYMKDISVRTGMRYMESEYEYMSLASKYLEAARATEQSQIAQAHQAHRARQARQTTPTNAR